MADEISQIIGSSAGYFAIFRFAALIDPVHDIRSPVSLVKCKNTGKAQFMAILREPPVTGSLYEIIPCKSVPPPVRVQVQQYPLRKIVVRRCACRQFGQSLASVRQVAEVGDI